MKYLLPCSCGKSVAVAPSQAGQRVRCACGRTLDVPAMRLVRQLPPAEDAATRPRRAASAWSRAHRLVFVLGLVMLASGAATAGYYQLVRAQLVTDEFLWDDLEGACATIDRLTADDAWDVWVALRDLGIGPYAPPIFVHHRRIASQLMRYVIGGAAVAGGGLVVMLLPLVWRPAPRRAPRRPAARK